MVVEAQNDGQAKMYVQDACNKLITNPIIEDFDIEIIEND
jgi:phosphoribosylformylglycinamidine (FGAM) synthase PurS component